MPTKYRNTEIILPRIKDKTRMSIFINFIQDVGERIYFFFMVLAFGILSDNNKPFLNIWS